jgi:hypothetical protein
MHHAVYPHFKRSFMWFCLFWLGVFYPLHSKVLASMHCVFKSRLPFSSFPEALQPDFFWSGGISLRCFQHGARRVVIMRWRYVGIEDFSFQAVSRPKLYKDEGIRTEINENNCYMHNLLENAPGWLNNL